MELTAFYDLLPDFFTTYCLSIMMFVIMLIICVLLVIRLRKSDKFVYNKFDEANRILNIILTAIFSRFSLSALLSVADSWGSSTGRPLYAPYEYYVYSFSKDYLRLALPFVCLITITLSVLFRRKGLRVLSFIIQFLPFSFFVINNILMSMSQNALGF